MGMNEIINLIVSNGLAVVIVGYFILKDYRTSTQQLETMESVNKLMGRVEGVLTAIEKKLD